MSTFSRKTTTVYSFTPKGYSKSVFVIIEYQRRQNSRLPTISIFCQTSFSIFNTKDASLVPFGMNECIQHLLHKENGPKIFAKGSSHVAFKLNGGMRNELHLAILRTSVV